MEAVERPGRNESRDRLAAPLDQDAAESEVGEACKDQTGIDPPLAGCWEEKLGISGSLFRPGARVKRSDADGPSGAVGKHPPPRIEPPPWIEDDPHRVLPGNPAYGKLRIIGGYRSGSDQDGVDERAEPVKTADVLRSRDVVGVAACRRDPPVQALADLPHRQATRQLKWDKQRKDATCGLGQCTDNIPTAGRIHMKPDVREGFMVDPARLPAAERSGPEPADEIPRDALIDPFRQ